MIIVEQYQLIPYDVALNRQFELVAAVLSDEIAGAIMTLQHEPCLTLGRHADRKFLLGSETSLRHEGISLIDTDRGGEVTAHNPGQLVIYPILPIKKFALSPKKLVHILLSCVVDYLEGLGLTARIDDERPGVWLEDAKICAVGIRIKSRVSMHGIALNVTNDLSIFSKIVPCGIADAGVTRLQDHVSPCPPLEEIGRTIVELLSRKLSAPVVAKKMF